MPDIKTLHAKFVGLASNLPSAVLLLVRAGFGYQFMLTGWGKIGTAAGVERTAKFFAELGIPAPTLNAYMAGATECFGGCLLLIGLASRLISIPLAFTMLVAYATAHHGSLAIFTNEDGVLEGLRNFFDQAPFPFLCASLVILAFGPGRVSVDHLIAKYVKRETPLATQVREANGG